VQEREFVRYVEGIVADGLDSDGAARAITATLATLGECLPREQARDLAAQLPVSLQGPLVDTSEEAEVLGVQEFLRRIADRERVSPSEAFDHARAVLDALTEAVTGHELQRVRACLPAEFAELFEPPAAARWPQTHRQRPHP